MIDYAQDYLGASWGTYGFPAESYFYHQADRQSDSKAIFAQADWEFAPTWNLTVGGRMTRDTRKDVGGQYWDTAFSDDPAIYFKGLHNPGTPGTPGFVPFNSSDLKPGMGGYYGAGEYLRPGDRGRVQTLARIAHRLFVFAPEGGHQVLPDLQRG